MIDNLEPSVCVSLTSHIHGKQFFNRKVYVNSVVQKTPEKVAGTEEPAVTEELAVTEEIAVTEDAAGNLEVEGDSAGSDSSSDESEGEQSSTVTKPPCSKLFSNMTESRKRPAKGSPEVTSEISKRDKKKNKSAPVRSSSRQGKNENKK